MGGFARLGRRTVPHHLRTCATTSGAAAETYRAVDDVAAGVGGGSHARTQRRRMITPTGDLHAPVRSGEVGGRGPMEVPSHTGATVRGGSGRKAREDGRGLARKQPPLVEVRGGCLSTATTHNRRPHTAGRRGMQGDRGPAAGTR